MQGVYNETKTGWLHKSFNSYDHAKLRQNEEHDDMKSGTRRRKEQFSTGFRSSDDRNVMTDFVPYLTPYFYIHFEIAQSNCLNTGFQSVPLLCWTSCWFAKEAEPKVILHLILHTKQKKM